MGKHLKLHKRRAPYPSFNELLRSQCADLTRFSRWRWVTRRVSRLWTTPCTVWSTAVAHRNTVAAVLQTVAPAMLGLITDSASTTLCYEAATEVSNSIQVVASQVWSWPGVQSLVTPAYM